MPDPVIQLRGVSVRFGKQPVLRDLSLDIAPHQTVCVIGESGCGKTVLLKLLVGLLTPTTGEVRFEGKPLAAMRESELTKMRLRVGFLFQQAAHFDGALWRIAGIAVHQFVDACTECARHDGHHGFGAARPFILVAAAFGTDAPFESSETLLIAQLEKALGFVLRRDVSLHGGSIGAEFAGLAADQRDHGFAFQLAAQIPECCVKAGHGASQIGAGILVFAFLDEVQRVGKVQRIGAERMAGDLAVEHLNGDI